MTGALSARECQRVYLCWLNEAFIYFFRIVEGQRKGLLAMYRYRRESSLFVVFGLVMFVVGFCLTSQTVMALEIGFERTSTTDQIDKAAASHSEINTLRKLDTIDMDAIDALYVADIQALVQVVDADNGLTLDADIIQAMDDMRNEIDTSLAAQVLDKSIRRMFHLMAMDRISTVKGSAFNEQSADALNVLWDEGFAAFAAIDGTIGQTARVLSNDKLLIEDSVDPGLNDNVVRAFINGQDAINKDADDSDEGAADGDLTRIKVQRQIIRFTMERGFYLVVLKEIKGVLEKRDSNPDGARKNQKEGEVFHTAIADKVNKDNPDGNAIIEAQLTGPLEDVVADTLVREYSKAWVNGTIRELDGNSGAMADDNIQKAVETAHEGILFANMMIDDLEQRLTKDDRDTVTRSFGDLILASAKGSKAEALALRETIRGILADYIETL